MLSIVPLGWKHLPLPLRGMMILSIPMLCLLSAIAVFSSYQQFLAQDKRLVAEVKQIKIVTKQLSVALSEAEAGIQNYGLTDDSRFLVSYETAIEQIPSLAAQLQQFDRPVPSPEIAQLEILLQQSQQQLQLQRSSLDTVLRTADRATLYQWLQQDDAVLNQTRQTIDRLIEREEERLEQFQANLELQQQRGLWIIWGFIGVGIVGTGLAVALFRQLAQELSDRENQLQQANQQLVQANDRLQRFTADASHELRAPVASILGQAQAGILATEQNPHILMQRLQTIVGIAKSMSTLVSNLLFLARHEEAQIKATAIDIVPLLHQLRETFAIEAAQRQIQFTALIPEQPIQVQIEPDLLRQAIANLLDNALRYTPAGGTVQLQVFLQLDQVTIEVRDTGIGIPETDLPYIFDRFYRVDRARTKTGGFGLGLAIVQQIVHTFGGKITVSSQIGQGSQFQIVLPRSLFHSR